MFYGKVKMIIAGFIIRRYNRLRQLNRLCNLSPLSVNISMVKAQHIPSPSVRASNRCTN